MDETVKVKVTLGNQNMVDDSTDLLIIGGISKEEGSQSFGGIVGSGNNDDVIKALTGVLASLHHTVGSVAASRIILEAAAEAARYTDEDECDCVECRAKREGSAAATGDDNPYIN